MLVAAARKELAAKIKVNRETLAGYSSIRQNADGTFDLVSPENEVLRGGLKSSEEAAAAKAEWDTEQIERISRELAGVEFSTAEKPPGGENKNFVSVEKPDADTGALVEKIAGLLLGSRRFKDFSVHSVEAKLTEEQKRFVDLYEKLFGLKITFVRITGDAARVNGFYHPSMPNRIVLNADARKAFDFKGIGALYRVELDVENEDLLDWDKPLSEQSEKVKKAADALLPFNRRSLTDAEKGKVYVAVAGDNLAWPEAKRREHALGKITGHEFCRALEKARGSDKAASLALKKAGIPGLRYWDGASRTEREGTHNYVIWDEGKITIKEANGMPIAPGETEIKFALAPEIAKAELREGRRGVSIPPENLVPPWRPKGWYRGVRRWLDRKFFDRSAELKEFSKLAAALRGLEGIDETDSNDPFNIVTARRLTAEGRIKEMILNGTLDAFGNRTGASLASVFAGLDKAGMEAFLKYAKYRLLAMRRGGDWRMWAAEEGIPTDDVRVDPARLEELEGWARRVVEHFSSAFPQEAGRIEAALGLSEEQPREPGVERVEFPALLALSFMSDSPLPLLGEDGGLGYRLQGSEFRVKNVLEQSVIQAVRTLFNARQLAAREAEREVTPAELNGMFDEAAAFVEGLANGEFADIYAGLSEVEIGDLAEYLYGLRAIALLRDAKTGRRNPGISRRKAEQLRKRHESEDFKRRAERVWSFHADFG